MPEHDLAPIAPPITAPHTTADPATSARRPTADTALDVALLRDAGDAVAPTADLFRSPGFFRLHAGSFSRAWYATALDASTGKPIAGGWFAEVAPGEVRSGARGPFGAFHSPFAPLPIVLASRLVAATEDELRARDVRTVRITLPPAAYEEASHGEWMNVYLRHGYRVAPPDLHYHVWVGDEPLADRMSSSNRAVVRTAERKGMFARVLRANERADAYTVNVQHRVRRGRPMTMSLEALLAMDAARPGTSHWFGVFQQERMIAASVCLRVAPHALHVFALGEVDGVDRLCPMTLLVSHLHDWCRDHQIALLDLGMATEGGLPDEGRMAFKRNLGFDVSPKYTVQKELGL